jgi:hypothetical protein
MKQCAIRRARAVLSQPSRVLSLKELLLDLLRVLGLYLASFFCLSVHLSGTLTHRYIIELIYYDIINEEASGRVVG